MKDLEPDKKDYLISVAKGVVGACPILGPLVAESISILIPNQRFDRVVEFIIQLEEQIRQIDNKFNDFERNLKSIEGLDIIEEGLIQATRSVSIERKVRLAHLIACALTSDEIKYEETRKLLNLYRELTDPELLWLIYYSMNPVLRPGPHRDFVEKHPDVLKPVSRELSAPQEQVEKAALQDSYKNTLHRLGLINERQSSYQITALGRLLVRYIGSDDNG